MDYKKILEYIIECDNNGNPITILEASKIFDCSVSSIRKYIAKLKNSEIEQEQELYRNYIEISKHNQKQARINGGKAGTRKTGFSKEQIENIFKLIVEKDCTLRQLENELKIPSSTIYDSLKKYLEKSKWLILQEIFEKHRRNSKKDYNNDTENSPAFHKVGTEISKPGTRIRK